MIMYSGKKINYVDVLRRAKKKYKLAEIADKLGISPGHISNMARNPNVYPMSERTIDKIKLFIIDDDVDLS